MFYPFPPLSLSVLLHCLFVLLTWTIKGRRILALYTETRNRSPFHDADDVKYA